MPLADSRFWDDRFGGDEFVYGTNPNEFFRDNLPTTPGRILLPLEGEGRNAVFAAQKGWDVHAFDFSEAGKKKALSLAETKSVCIRYDTVDVTEFSSTDGPYDVIAFVFSHVAPAIWHLTFTRLMENHLKPGGTILFQVFSKKQLGMSSGGPKDPDWLWTKELAAGVFPGLRLEQLEEVECVLREGPFHDGKAYTIQLVGKKPETTTMS